jgi:hypothetical protein
VNFNENGHFSQYAHAVKGKDSRYGRGIVIYKNN